MEGYGYSYPGAYPPIRPADGEYPDHGDGFGDYYGVGPQNEDRGSSSRVTRTRQRSRRNRDTNRARTRSDDSTKSRSQSRSRSRSRSRSKSRSRSRSRSRSHSRAKSRNRSQTRSKSRQKKPDLKAPGFLDAFRVLYLSTNNNKKNTSKFLLTKKRQDHIQEILKRDGLGSKRWLFYPRPKNEPEPPAEGANAARENCDQRIKVDGDFFRKYKRNKKIDLSAPIAKLKRWELVFYKKLGFVQAI